MVKQGQQKAPLKQKEFLEDKMLNDDRITRLCTQIMKFNLNNTKENEIDIEKEYKTYKTY